VCLANLCNVVKRCEEVNLVLNWEKSHFVVQEKIVLGHKVSKKGIEVDKAKVDLISDLPVLSSVKQVRSFLGHVGFYRRFMKDFSKVARPPTNLLTKDAPFFIDESCVKAFEKFQSSLVSAPLCIPLIFLCYLRLYVMHLISLLGLFWVKGRIGCLMSFIMLVELLLILKRIIQLLRKSRQLLYLHLINSVPTFCVQK